MNGFQSLKLINVGLCFGGETWPVGRLATREGKIYFEYVDEFISRGMEISPFKLPLGRGLVTFDPFIFEGLPGVFDDSLPDGWGRLLFDRFMRSINIVPQDITPLDRLAFVGKSAMGALVFEPDKSERSDYTKIDLDRLSQQTQSVLQGESEDVLQELLSLNGSSAGARPKALIGVDKEQDEIIHGIGTLPERYQYWIVKFANSMDGKDAGAIEYVYSLMARKAGVEMMDTHLFSALEGAGYFATKRFDRNNVNKRLHTHTACGLLHSDFRVPSLDYEDLINLTEVLTKDVREVIKMYRLAVFNVLSHNRDDHSKNFTFLMNSQGEWSLSPAYDLTFSAGPSGEQSTMVMGEGKNPQISHLIKLGQEAKLGSTLIHEIIDQTLEALSEWKKLAKTYGVMKTNIGLIDKVLRNIQDS